jgi:nitroreductase
VTQGHPVGESTTFAPSRQSVPLLNVWCSEAIPRCISDRLNSFDPARCRSLDSVDTWDAITARRKLTNYAGKPIEEEKLKKILEAGRRSPSARNEQRWDFVLVRDRQQLVRLSAVWRGAAHIADAAAAVAVVAPYSDDLRTNASINFDLGQAMMSMIVVATDLGIGSRHGSVDDYQLGAEILGLPDDRRLTWLMGLGYPGDRPLKPIRVPDRRPYDEVVHLERW